MTYGRYFLIGAQAGSGIKKTTTLQLVFNEKTKTTRQHTSFFVDILILNLRTSRAFC